MLISGFTVIRNARIMGYPVVEAIRSILPICDEFIVGVGQSDDDTRAMIEAIDHPALRIIDTVWESSQRSGGRILSEKTNEALAHCRGDWCFYIQGDEVVHEQDLAAIARNCAAYRDDARVEALLFKYVHFFGSYSVVATARNWYRREVRIVKRSANARSVGDAQSFLIDGRKAWVRPADATMYHYGHARSPRDMTDKQHQIARWYSGNANYGHPPRDQHPQIYGLRKYTGTHPAVMRELVAAQDWEFEPRFDPRGWNRTDYKNLISDTLESVMRYRIGERKKYRLL